MGWFDSPPEAVRQRMPKSAQARIDEIEDYALYRLDLELVGGVPQYLGIILALWAKAGIVSGEFDISARDAERIQRVYAKCYRALRDDAFIAFTIAAELAERGRMFETGADLYRQVGINLCR